MWTKSRRRERGDEMATYDTNPYIRNITECLAGNRHGISMQPINLTVRKHHCPDLTLIDLPGITRNPVGNQPKDIYDQIITLIKRCILLFINYLF